MDNRSQIRPRAQLSQAPRLNKEKEWTSKKIRFRLVELRFSDISLIWSNKLYVLTLESQPYFIRHNVELGTGQWVGGRVLVILLSSQNL